MNKKAALFATLTIVIMFVFALGYSYNKDKVLKENNLLDAGNVSKNLIDLSLKETEIQFFIDKSVKIASYKSLLDLGAKGGFFTKKDECTNLNGYTLINDKCQLPLLLNEEFFEYFKANFDKIISEKGFSNFEKEINLREDNKFLLNVKNKIDFSGNGIKYEPSFESSLVLDFDLEIIKNVISAANNCVQKERLKGQGQNLLFEDCRNDPGFNWVIKEDNGNVFFDATTKNKPYNLGEVLIRFAIPL